MYMLFDLVAGTSTGSLLATAIVLPNNNTAEYPDQKNKFFAEEAIKVYKDNGSVVFKKFTYSLTTLIIGIVGFALLGALIGYNIGVKLYTNPRHEDAMLSFHAYIKQRKDQCKGKDNNMDLLTQLKNSLILRLLDIDNGAYLQKVIETGNLDEIHGAEEQLTKSDFEYREKKGRKWIFMLAGIILFGLFGWWVVPKVQQLSHSSYDRSGFE